MSFGGAKIYFDGSHYIAIPKELQLSRKPKSKRQSKKQEILVMKSNNNGEVMTTAIDINELFEALYKENKAKKQRNVIKEIVKGLNPYAVGWQNFNLIFPNGNDIVMRISIDYTDDAYEGPFVPGFLNFKVSEPTGTFDNAEIKMYFGIDLEYADPVQYDEYFSNGAKKDFIIILSVLDKSQNARIENLNINIDMIEY